MRDTETWDIRPSPTNGPEVVMHDAVWTVLTNDENTEAVYALRIAGHGQDPFDPDVLRVVISPEMAEALVAQFHEDARPYLEQLVSSV